MKLKVLYRHLGDEMHTEKGTRTLALRQGFTLIELFVVITIVAVLATLILSMVQIVRRMAEKTACSSNMRQIGTVFLASAADNKGMIYLDDYPGTASPGAWLWDVWETSLKEHILSPYGMPQKIFYCPSLKGSTTARANSAISSTGSVGLGCWLMVERVQQPGQTDYWRAPTSGTTDYIPGYITGTTMSQPSQRILASDCATAYPATFSFNMSGTGIWTAHLDNGTNLPRGNNGVFLDGHVEWHNYSKMLNRLNRAAAWFWW